mmetsp:Transcript_37841/g.49825  ORF Transcript_37841/g.49825 Transcript_37841/m.49825 type:complete len:80 (+) Transcript_37841:373-612(+)
MTLSLHRRIDVSQFYNICDDDELCSVSCNQVRFWCSEDSPQFCLNLKTKKYNYCTTTKAAIRTKCHVHILHLSSPFIKP